MQYEELVYPKNTTMTKGSRSQTRPEKETIHSGHFMVSHFEAEAQDDEDDLAVPVPEEDEGDNKLSVVGVIPMGIAIHAFIGSSNDDKSQQQISIETSLNKLFQCMSLAYRQKLTSPKWNRFKGIKLRWKDKIRLNNVIWRCWHMQFIMKQNTLVCQFASPLDVDTHIKPEATILEGKYWKRRAEAVTAEYKKWRMYYRNRAFGYGTKDVSDVISDMDVLDWQLQGDSSHMLVDEDYIEFMSDTLFSTITSNQPFAFPDTREIARSANLADFIQPSLGPLQPNLEDFIDTLEPLQDLLTIKLPPVPEETISSDDNAYRSSFSQALMDPNLQQALEQTSHYPLSMMQSQHIHHMPSQVQHQQGSHTDMHPPTDQMMAQVSLGPTMHSVNQNQDNQSLHNSSIVTAQRGQQNQRYGAQQVARTSVTSQGNIIPNIKPQPTQPQHMMLQPYGVHATNMNSMSIQQKGVHTGGIMTQQTVVQPSQIQKPTQHYMQNQKIYPQVPVGGYQERKYNVQQGVHHQSRMDTSFGPSGHRSRSGSGGYSDRQRPRPSFNPHPYPQFNTSPVQSDKSYAEQSLEHNNMQQISLTAGIYLGNLGQDQPTTANLVVNNQGRFKIPSPPLQVVNNPLTSTHRASLSGTSQQPPAKIENFRSNSLPLGSSLSSVLGGSSRSRRKPRSGSSSPAPPRPPLLAAASEPLLSPSSMLLAHLLNSKDQGQGIYKPNSVQSLAMDSPSQPSLAPQVPPSVLTPGAGSSSSPQLTSLSGGSPTGLSSPQSPPSPLEGRSELRAGLIHAEQKRRYNIKNGFDILQSLIPQLSQNPNAKVSKAAMLQKGADYIKQLQAERNQMKDEMDSLRQQIECLNNSISNCQSLLPATGAPVSRQQSGRLKEMFDEYVCQRTNENWKFWIFSLLVEPLLTSFNNSVSPASTDEFKRSTFSWAEQHCSLVEMRPAVLNSLRTLCTTTEILSDPERLPEEAQAAVNKKKPKDSKSS